VNLTAITSLIGIIIGLIGVVSPILGRRDKLLRLRKLNDAWSTMPAGPGRDALADARDRLALKLSLPILAPVRPGTTLVRNVTGISAFVAFLSVFTHDLPIPWLNDPATHNTAVPAFLQDIAPTFFWWAGLVLGGIASFCQGFLLAHRDIFFEEELNRRLKEHSV